MLNLRRSISATGEELRSYWFTLGLPCLLERALINVVMKDSMKPFDSS